MGWRVRRIWPHELARPNAPRLLARRARALGRPNAPRLLARLSRALGLTNCRSRVPATAATSVIGHPSLGIRPWAVGIPPRLGPSFSLPVPVLILFPVRPRGNRRPVA